MSGSHRCAGEIQRPAGGLFPLGLAWQRPLRDGGRQLRRRVVVRGMEANFTLEVPRVPLVATGWSSFYLLWKQNQTRVVNPRSPS